jgi:2-oxoglutarate ferredoxin oxidoreductase subunit alpha
MKNEFSNEIKLWQWASFGWMPSPTYYLYAQMKVNIRSYEITKPGQEARIVIQTEDEIAAVNSASGACLAGARAATSTSGPGFSLMAEGLGWAGNSEVPLVITYYQRGGPATGHPTRHCQQDLRFAMHAAHGESQNNPCFRRYSGVFL